MRSDQDLPFLSAVELTEAYRARTLSPIEVVDAILSRIERVNPGLNAFTIVLGEEARESARRAEEVIQRGNDRQPLLGIPFTIKDLTATKGIPTARGSKAFAGVIPDEDGISMERLHAAGGVFLGKTTTPELGNKGITESPLTGTTSNPWKRTHTAGGSSGGAAAATAAGLGPLAEGTDGGGSIRIPASCCGVVGLKPSYGRVPLYRPTSGFGTLAHDGPITRTVADAALMLSVLAGPDVRDPLCLSDVPEDYPRAVVQPSVRGLRVAYSRNLGLVAVDPEVVARTDAAAAVFASELGAAVDEATPDLPDPEEAMMVMWSVTEGVAAVDEVLPRVKRDDVDPSLLELADRGERISAFDYFRAAHAFRGRYYAGMRRFFERYDLLLTPTLAVPPFPHPGWMPGPGEIGGRPINPFLGWLLTFPFNLTGQPAISVPCGFSRDGLPIGLQIVGRVRADGALLRAAAAYEEAAPWKHLRPALD
jgi:aspartyl-tRNA(Asn)/glutamyl-tRNA(Gln) amidotransferase subunit A